MILEALVLTKLALVDPADPLYRHYYPSGVKASDGNDWWWGPSSSKLPILSLCENIYDKDKKIVQAGHYEASISKDKTDIYLIQNGNIVGVFKIGIFKENLVKVTINKIETEKIRRDYLILRIRQDDKEAVSIAPIAP